MQLSGLTATIPVTSVGGKVYAKLPMATTFAVVNPADYGAPDPADFADPEHGLSSLLSQLEGVKKTGEKRSGDQVLTTYSGTLPGSAVKTIIPSADEKDTYQTVVGRGPQGPRHHREGDRHVLQRRVRHDVRRGAQPVRQGRPDHRSAGLIGAGWWPRTA